LLEVVEVDNFTVVEVVVLEVYFILQLMVYPQVQV
jgi:hypothetical protein